MNNLLNWLLDHTDDYEVRLRMMSQPDYDLCIILIGSGYHHATRCISFEKNFDLVSILDNMANEIESEFRFEGGTKNDT